MILTPLPNDAVAPLTKFVPLIVMSWLVAPCPRELGLVDSTVGPRLTVKPLASEAVQSSLDELRPWMPWAHEQSQSPADVVNLLRRFRGAFDLDQNFVYGIFSPDEREVWVCDAANRRVHVFDATVMPPRQVTSIALREEPGWARSHSARCQGG